MARMCELRPQGSNPCRYVRRFRERKRERFLSDAEYRRLGAALRKAETTGTEPASAVALVADKEIRESRARGPKQVLRRLGRHPGDGAPVWLKTGHFGPFVAHRRRYAGGPQDLALDTLTLEQAVDLLDR